MSSSTESIKEPFVDLTGLPLMVASKLDVRLLQPRVLQQGFSDLRAVPASQVVDTLEIVREFNNRADGRGELDLPDNLTSPEEVADAMISLIRWVAEPYPDQPELILEITNLTLAAFHNRLRNGEDPQPPFDNIYVSSQTERITENVWGATNETQLMAVLEEAQGLDQLSQRLLGTRCFRLLPSTMTQVTDKRFNGNDRAGALLIGEIAESWMKRTGTYIRTDEEVDQMFSELKTVVQKRRAWEERLRAALVALGLGSEAKVTFDHETTDPHPTIIGEVEYRIKVSSGLVPGMFSLEFMPVPRTGEQLAKMLGDALSSAFGVPSHTG